MTDKSHDPNQMTGAAMIVRALIDHGVQHLFGYPGGAVLPIYDEIFQQSEVEHILVRHEQGAGHAAEGYARSTGKPGVVLVTSGPGATNMVTPLTDALMDSIPLVCITGQVPTHLIGNDAFQECDTVGITRPCTKHNWLVRDVNDLAKVLHEAFYVATSGRPGPGAGRRAQGRAVRDRHLSSAAQVRRARVLYAARQGRCGADPQSRGAAGLRQAAGDLFRRRRHQFRTRGVETAARAGRGDGLPDHLDPDGSRRLSGDRQELARHARHARHLRVQHGDA